MNMNNVHNPTYEKITFRTKSKLFHYKFLYHLRNGKIGKNNYAYLAISNLTGAKTRVFHKVGKLA